MSTSTRYDFVAEKLPNPVDTVEDPAIPLIKLVQISKLLKKPLSYFLDDFNGSPDIAIKFNQAFVNAIDKLEDNI